MEQVGKNLTDFDGILGAGHFLLMYRDAKYSACFRQVLSDAGAQVVRLPAMSPNLNAYAERLVRSLKEECLDRLILFGEGALRNAMQQCLEHYHTERNHQGLGNRLIDTGDEVARLAGTIKCHKRLGGLLQYHYRDAA